MTTARARWRAFALAMKAAAKLGRRRFLRMEAKPDIVVLQNVSFTEAEMQDVAAVVGKDLFTDELRETLGQFEQAKNFGSLIVPKLRDPAETLRVVEARDFGGDLLLKEVQERVVAVLRMAEVLSPKYHVVVANPPYMGSKGMNSFVSDFLKNNYPDSKADLFAAFIERCHRIVVKDGLCAMVTMQSWMFLSSYEKLRIKLEENSVIEALAHMANMVMGIAFGTSATIWSKSRQKDKPGHFCYVEYEDLDANKVPFIFPPENDRNLSAPNEKRYYTATADDFQRIPGGPVAYWLSDQLVASFDERPLEDLIITEGQNKTADNERFLRFTWEVDASKHGRDQKWLPYAKGGPFRRWYGNIEHVVDWSKPATAHYRKSSSCRIVDERFWYQPGATWTDITSGGASFRYLPPDSTFDMSGPAAFFKSERHIWETLALLNTPYVSYLLPIFNPTFHAQLRDIKAIPNLCPDRERQADSAKQLTQISRADWDAFETSWDFTTLPLLQPDHRTETLAATFTALRTHWQGMTNEMQRLEEENNRIFIDAYGLQDELTPEVPLNEITLTCNPAYRYGIKNDSAANETRLRADTMAEFLSYAVGCMFGRYSLDAPGLILANQGETLADYLARIPEPSFMPDEDNVIPVLDADWFPDDITDRFRQFLRVTFGEAHFRENLRYIEDALGKDIRKYFTRDFYADHVKRYKKRPIYWMFSSPKGTFNALIYMHRYRTDTVSVVLNQYLREFIRKLEIERARLEKLAADPAATQGQSTKAQKDIGAVIKQITELTEWERDVVYPMAQQKIGIDLDDGVKRNYPLFTGALKQIKGLKAADG